MNSIWNGLFLMTGDKEHLSKWNYLISVGIIGLTVMAFTGYWLEDLQARESPLLPHVDLLVDGPYDRERYTSQRRFIGSTNQRMHFLTDAYRPDDPRFAEPNTAELRYDGEGDVQVVGFPFPSVRDAFGPKRKRSRGVG